MAHRLKRHKLKKVRKENLVVLVEKKRTYYGDKFENVVIKEENRRAKINLGKVATGLICLFVLNQAL